MVCALQPWDQDADDWEAEFGLRKVDHDDAVDASGCDAVEFPRDVLVEAFTLVVWCIAKAAVGWLADYDIADTSFGIPLQRTLILSTNRVIAGASDESQPTLCGLSQSPQEGDVA
jgi:hypothetical protein